MDYPGVCAHCRSSMTLEWNAGYLVWLCPNRNDGQHPLFLSITTNTSGPELQPVKYPRTP